jgi:hypothetical protein
VLALTVMPVWRGRATRSRRAALLGAATGICLGFEAAVIKEFSSHVSDGLGAIVSNWSLYVLVGGGALTMLLASHAMAAGPLAASQPGFTIVDPLAATFLGLSLFGEHIRTGILDLAGEALALALLIAGVSALSHSHLITGEDGSPSSRPADPRRRWRPKAGPDAAGHLQMPLDGAGHLRNYSGRRTTADDAKR